MSEILPVIVTIRYEKGEFTPDSLVDKMKQESFLEQIKEGMKFSIMYEQITDDGTSAQLNYFHKLCRVISEDTGQNMEDQILEDGKRIHGVKSEAKIKAGLWITKTELKSSGKFSKSDFTAAIAGAVALAEDLGINIHSL